MGNKKQEDDGFIAANKRARHEFEVIETFEAGIVLQGTEVKSLRENGGNIAEAWAKLEGGELYLIGANIPVFKNGSFNNHEPTRNRKLLIHRRELKKLEAQTSRKGLTIIPLRMYFNKRGIAKLQMGIGRGKKLHDKRDDLRKRSDQREVERAIRQR